MIKLKAPSKECLIYRVVAWLNNKASDVLCGDYNEIKPPQNSCQLGWQAIGWVVVLLNTLYFVAIPLALLSEVMFISGALQFVLDTNGGSWLTMFGVVLGLVVVCVLCVVYLVLTSWVFWFLVGMYLNLCIWHYALRDKPWEVNGSVYKYDGSDHYLFGGCIVIFFLVHIVCNKVMVVLRKIKINCDDIK